MAKKKDRILSAFLGALTAFGVVCQAAMTYTRAEEPLVDFTVEVEPGRDIRVLQITDTQTVDPSQKRWNSRIGDEATEKYGIDPEDERCFRYVREVVASYKPDLILLTGDLVFGEFDDSGEKFLSLVAFMESLGTPWAPIFGNHENESHKGVDWQCRQLEAADNCLFRQRSLTGNGNYSVGVVQNGKLVRVFYMLDSNGCAFMSDESFSNGHSKKTYGFGQDQIDWYTESINRIKKESPDTKISMAFHAEMSVWQDAFAQYPGFDSSKISDANPLDLDKVGNPGDFGLVTTIYSASESWDNDRTVWNGIKALGVDSLFIGHLHANTASMVYEGVRLTYGLKSSTYDQCLYRTGNGYTASYSVLENPVVGGTAIDISSDGTADVRHIYYSDIVSNDDPIPASAERLALGSIETAKQGNNLSSLFTAMKNLENVPSGAGGDGVYGAEGIKHIGGTNGGVCTAVDLGKYIGDLDGRKIYLRYYIPSYQKSGNVSWKLAENGGSKKGTDRMPYSTSEIQYDRWVNLDITAGVVKFISDTGHADIGLTYWAGLKGAESTSVYVDGIYITEKPSDDPVPENSERVTLDTVEVPKEGTNLASLFTPASLITGAPAGAGGENVFGAAGFGHIGGTNGGICAAVDLGKYNLLNKRVYLRYYVPAYSASGNPSWKLAENAGSKRGTGFLPFSAGVEKYGYWTNLDITEGVRTFLSAGQTNFAITYWAALSGQNKASAYIDAIYLVSEGGEEDSGIMKSFRGQKYNVYTFSDLGLNTADYPSDGWKTEMKDTSYALSFRLAPGKADSFGINIRMRAGKNGGGFLAAVTDGTLSISDADRTLKRDITLEKGKEYTVEVGSVIINGGDSVYTYIAVSGNITFYYIAENDRIAGNLLEVTLTPAGGSAAVSDSETVKITDETGEVIVSFLLPEGGLTLDENTLSELTDYGKDAVGFRVNGSDSALPVQLEKASSVGIYKSYEITFVSGLDGSDKKTLTYNSMTGELSAEEPQPVPENGYTATWEKYTVGPKGNITVRAVYTPAGGAPDTGSHTAAYLTALCLLLCGVSLALIPGRRKKQ